MENNFPEDLLQICTQNLLPYSDDDNELDLLLSQVPDPKEFPEDSGTSGLQATHDANSQNSESMTAHSSKPARFVTVNEEDVKNAQKSAVPVNTQRQTNWSLNVWKEWSEYRRRLNMYDCPSHLFIMAKNPWDLNRWLCRFVLEVRRKDGKEYPPNTLHQLFCGILRYVRDRVPELDIFKQPSFSGFQKTLDAEMKRLRACGMGSAPKRAEPITLSEENSLWDQKILGAHSPRALVDTMVYMCGLYFALRSESEHRQLRNSDIEVIERPGEVGYVMYNESTSKNNSGGLKNRKVKPKSVVHYANTENPQRCFVRLLKVYREHRPSSESMDHDAFYLTPISEPKGNVWYKTIPIGINSLRSTVSTLCQKGGIDGYKTNHSLRVTAATRLFHEGIDEQLIMERTGHRSIDGVRTYKRTCSEQHAKLSDVLHGSSSSATKKPKHVEKTEESMKTPLKTDLEQGEEVQNKQEMGRRLDTPLAPSTYAHF